MAAEPPRLRELLRSQQVFPAGMPEFDPAVAPDDPVTLFLRWLEVAIRDGVPAPHAMTADVQVQRGRIIVIGLGGLAERFGDLGIVDHIDQFAMLANPGIARPLDHLAFDEVVPRIERDDDTYLRRRIALADHAGHDRQLVPGQSRTLDQGLEDRPGNALEALTEFTLLDLDPE